MSIKHFRDLSAKRKRIFFDHPEDFIVQEKVDGSQFIFGLTDGKLWTARKTTAEKFYKPEDWPEQMWAQNFRVAHTALYNRNMIDRLRSRVGENFEAHCELLSSRFPNTIIYDSTTSYMVVYNMEFPAITTTGEYDLRTSTNGKDIVAELHKFQFHIRSLGSYPLRIHELARLTSQAPEDEQYDTMLNFLSPHFSEFGFTRPEGFVFKHKDGWMFKAVNIEKFTRLNQANYEFRKKLFKTPGQRTDSLMDVYTRDINSGMEHQEAAAKALRALDAIRELYFNNDVTTAVSHVHVRNVEAMASLYEQLGEK